MTYNRYIRLNEPDNVQLTDIINGLNRFGLSQIGTDSPSRVAILCERNNNQVVGGIVGHSLLDRFYLTQLWVAEEHRSEGIGSELLNRIERIAQERYCRDILVDTLNDGAVTFYQKRGFTVYLVNSNYIPGFNWHFLSKLLAWFSTL